MSVLEASAENTAVAEISARLPAQCSTCSLSAWLCWRAVALLHRSIQRSEADSAKLTYSSLTLSRRKIKIKEKLCSYFFFVPTLVVASALTYPLSSRTPFPVFAPVNKKTCQRGSSSTGETWTGTVDRDSVRALNLGVHFAYSNLKHWLLGNALTLNYVVSRA